LNLFAIKTLTIINDGVGSRADAGLGGFIEHKSGIAIASRTVICCVDCSVTILTDRAAGEALSINYDRVGNWANTGFGSSIKYKCAVALAKQCIFAIYQARTVISDHVEALEAVFIFIYDGVRSALAFTVIRVE
jgi:hypothetical protein